MLGPHLVVDSRILGCEPGFEKFQRRDAIFTAVGKPLGELHGIRRGHGQGFESAVYGCPFDGELGLRRQKFVGCEIGMVSLLAAGNNPLRGAPQVLDQHHSQRN